jgi:predicted Zn-dependent protease
MLNIGWQEFLVLLGVWLFLFGGWRVIRLMNWQFQWVIRDLGGDSKGARRAEARLGKLMAESLTAEMPPVTDDSLTKSVEDVGGQLARTAAAQQRSFCFQVVHSSRHNAFILPGNSVFVTDTLVSFCDQRRDELAFVLAHEMAHTLSGHLHDRILSSLLLRLLTGMVTGTGPLGRLVRRYLNRALTSAYSQDQEFEADAVATDLLRQSGFDVLAGDRFFARLETTQSGSQAHRYFASHPPLAARRARIQKRAARITHCGGGHGNANS